MFLAWLGLIALGLLDLAGILYLAGSAEWRPAHGRHAAGCQAAAAPEVTGGANPYGPPLPREMLERLAVTGDWPALTECHYESMEMPL
jgi:hypothetical protein